MSDAATSSRVDDIARAVEARLDLRSSPALQAIEIERAVPAPLHTWSATAASKIDDALRGGCRIRARTPCVVVGRGCGGGVSGAVSTFVSSGCSVVVLPCVERASLTRLLLRWCASNFRCRGPSAVRDSGCARAVRRRVRATTCRRSWLADEPAHRLADRLVSVVFTSAMRVGSVMGSPSLS